MVHVTKLYNTPDASSFMALGRIMSGTIRPGMKVKVLGEKYTSMDEEDMKICTTGTIALPQARYRLDMTQATAGNMVLIEGVDESISKTATITDVNGKIMPGTIFRPTPAL